MAKKTKLTPDQRVQLEKSKEQNRHFHELIERRQRRDEELSAARERRERAS